jgi:hypothetical protein
MVGGSHVPIDATNADCEEEHHEALRTAIPLLIKLIGSEYGMTLQAAGSLLGKLAVHGEWQLYSVYTSLI